MTQLMPKPNKRLIGRILMDSGLVTEDKLKEALVEQQRTNRLVGEILVAMGELDPRELNIVLSIQRELADPDQAIKMVAGVKKMLGEILFLADRITPEQLELALKEQKRTGERIGEVIVRLGMATQHDVNAALLVQNTMGAEFEFSSRLRLGEMLVVAGFITREQLDDALGRQAVTKKKLGQVLVESGLVDAKVIIRLVRLQEMLMRAVLIAALSIAATTVTVPEATAGGSATIGVSAYVPARAKLDILKEPSELVVTDADVRRGFVSIQDESILELKNNTRAGCVLSFTPYGFPVHEATVSVMGKDVVMYQDGGLISLPITGRATISLSYRFVLAEGTQPGTYTWPFILSVSPIQ